MTLHMRCTVTSVFELHVCIFLSVFHGLCKPCTINKFVFYCISKYIYVLCGSSKYLVFYGISKHTNVCGISKYIL